MESTTLADLLTDSVSAEPAIIAEAAVAAEMIVQEGPAVAMQRFNRREPEESSG